MNTTCSRVTLLLAMVGLGGCSGSDESQVSGLPSAETLVAASINPTPGSAAAITLSATMGSNGATSETPNRAEPFRNPFAPPKDPPPPPVVEHPEPEPAAAPEIRQPGMPPTIRLLGFMNIGEPKVLVSFRDELETLAIGDTLDDLKVIEIDSPDVTMLFGEREIKYSLFDQAWRHEGGQTSSRNNSRVQTRSSSTRPLRDTGSSASGGAAASATGREPSGIPGFAPHAGKPPGFQRPASSATDSTLGPLIASPPSGLPGLSSEASDGAEIGDGGFPRITGPDVDDGGQLGVDKLPALPGGL